MRSAAALRYDDLPADGQRLMLERVIGLNVRLNAMEHRLWRPRIHAACAGMPAEARRWVRHSIVLFGMEVGEDWQDVAAEIHEYIERDRAMT
jgi:hypothetical protein